jgi:4-amino-4-deoxy-L-arabinose transferase-like glycosyltransferase
MSAAVARRLSLDNVAFARLGLVACFAASGLVARRIVRSLTGGVLLGGCVSSALGRHGWKLVQFAALAVLLAVHALKNQRDSWLVAAAAVAGLGCGTKYPGGLLVLPMVLAGFFGAGGCTLRVKVVRFIKVATVFALVYLAVTPGTILQAVKFAVGVLYASISP